METELNRYDIFFITSSKAWHLIDVKTDELLGVFDHESDAQKEADILNKLSK